MRNSSYAVISLVSIALGTVIISPQLSPHSVAAVSPVLPEPQVTLEISDSRSVPAAITSESVVVTPQVITIARPAPSVPVEKKVIVSKVVPVESLKPSVSAEIPSHYPIKLTIPAIQLNSRIISVGVNAKGEMDVPSGKTNNVGWYERGVVPGQTGTAVMDAHVFAAFANLHSLAVGDDVYVDVADGSRLHFVVRAVKTHLLSELTPAMLFQQTDGRHLNLITCAGSLTLDRSTYDRRLIVYTELAS